MTDKLILSILSRLTALHAKEAVSVYITGSFNTPFYTDVSDIDVVMVWPELPKLRQRETILGEIKHSFNQLYDWSFLDAEGDSFRDAIKISDFKKIEIYHYDIQSLELKIALAVQDDTSGILYNLERRSIIKETNEFQVISDFVPTKEGKKDLLRNTMFEVMSSYEQLKNSTASSSELPLQDLESLLKTVHLSESKLLPSKKHWGNSVQMLQLPNDAIRALQNILANPTSRSFMVWIENYRHLFFPKADSFPTRFSAGHLEICESNPLHNEKIYKIIQRQKIRLLKYLSWPKQINSREDQEAFSKKATTQWHRHEAFHFQIILDDVFVGAISMHSFNWTDRSFEFGYWLDQEFEGKGYLTIALSELLNQSLKAGWVRPRIKCRDDNTRSISIAKRLDFFEAQRTETSDRIFLVFEYKEGLGSPKPLTIS